MCRPAATAPWTSSRSPAEHSPRSAASRYRARPVAKVSPPDNHTQGPGRGDTPPWLKPLIVTRRLVHNEPGDLGARWCRLVQVHGERAARAVGHRGTDPDTRHILLQSGQ